jgi:TonB family protein
MCANYKDNQMKIKLLLLVTLISFRASGQNDTSIYFSKYGCTVPSINEAESYATFAINKKNKLSLSTFTKKDNKWLSYSVIDITKKTDSSFLMTSDVKQIRVFHRIDSGYLINDYQDSKLLQSGFSKLIFPLIRYGLWKSYDCQTGAIESENLYNNDQLIFYKYWLSNSSFIQDSGRVFDTIAKFRGGDPAIISFINSNIDYPEAAKQDNIQGRAIVKFMVTASGDVVGARVTNKIDKALGDEAIRVIKLTRGKWIPAKSGDKNVNCFFMAPVTFQLK